MMHNIRFKTGMTVADLKRVVADWPEVGEDGEPTEVWLGTRDGYSNRAFEVCPLDKHGAAADLILCPRAW